MQHSTLLNLPRPNLPSEGASDSPVDLPQLFKDRDAIIDKLSPSDTGPLSSRPVSTGGSPGKFGRLYLTTGETDSPRLEFDYGTGWLVIARTGPDPTKEGSAVIAASDTRTNTVYGTMPTPDQVAGLVLPSDGYIELLYQATWQESAAGAGLAAIFLGNNQVKVAAVSGGTPGNQETSSSTVIPSNSNEALSSFSGGLKGQTAKSGGAYTGDATTGQIVGFVGSGGPVHIFAAAGTYTVSIRFKSSSGSVTVSNRRLKCKVI